MGSIPPELSLDLRASFVPKTIGDFIRDVSAIGNVTEKASKLEGFVNRLEEEMRKIDAFKRELPLCMLLLNDAIVYLKEDPAKCELAKNVEPVLEEFIPLKNKDCEENKEEGLNCNTKKEKDYRDKKNWMSSVQLWNTDDDNINDLKPNPKTQTKINEKRHGLETEDYFQGCTNRDVNPRTFVPLKPYSSFPTVRREEKDEFSLHGLSLLTPGIKNLKEEPVCVGNNRPSSIRQVLVSPSNAHSNSRAGSAQQQALRKQRRCWSPELHRRFVNALQQLGGPQVATPKQIRELMQVDGLTNDEVKSHLQKYRLHTRRLPSGSKTTQVSANQSMVVLGGLWMNQDQHGDSSKASSSQSGSPQGPFQLAPNGSGSPTAGDESMEDNSDAKSEGYSWKTHIHRPGKDDVHES